MKLAIMEIRRRLLICAAIALGAAAPFVGLAQRAWAENAPTGTYTEALLEITFSDQTDAVHTYDLSALMQAASEINSFYAQLSYGKLNFVVKPARVKLANTTAYYYGHCENDTKPPVEDRCTQFTTDAVAAELKADPHFFDGVDGVATLVSHQGNGQFSWTPIDVGIGHDVQRSYLQEFPLLSAALSYGPSLVKWSGWSHEFGHQLQHAAALAVGGKWNGHPAGYLSGYDLMDSCYPCGQAPYGLLGPPFVNDNRGAFPAWLDAGHVATVPIPTGTPIGQTFVLPPLNPGIATPVVQAVKVPIDDKRYYMVNARARQGADALQRGYGTKLGIFDEGIQIELIDEDADPPVTFCSGGGAGCVYKVSPPGYPYDLWHPGQTLSDPANQINIRTLNVVTGGYTVEIDRNVPSGSPNLFITPWLTPPMNTYESVDVWIDSSCNGYEDQGGELRYGRRADGTVVGNGDDPCINHENRIYATIHNIGQVASSPTTVTFQATTPLGVGVTGNWQTVNSAPLPAIAPGDSKTVYVVWTPQATLTPSQIASSHFAFHSCVRVVINQDTGDVVTSNKRAQENIDYFDAVVPSGGRPWPKINRSIAILNQYNERPGLDYDPHRMYTVRAVSHLPSGWTYTLNGGKPDIFLKPSQRANIAVVIAPTSAPAGQIYSFRADAYTYHWLTNPALPTTDPMFTHFAVGSVGGVELNAHTVNAATLTLTAAPGSNVAVVGGELRPARPNTTLAIDATNPRGATSTQLVKTDAAGNYKVEIKIPDNLRKGKWQFRSIWQGDMTYASAVSPLVSFQPR
jgi:hypothetical protein